MPWQRKHTSYSNPAGCTTFVRELMGFARKSDGTRTTVDLARLLHQCVDLVQMDARRNSIAVATVIDEEFPSLLLNGNEIQQVFVNIMQNAIAAMPDGGTLSVSLRNHGDRAVVLITDTGAGIAAENLNRVFEPFFTTKDPGSGTGLGLWISYRIIDDHGGPITVQSTPGHGSQFSVALPFADVDSAETRSPKGGGTPA